MSRIIAFLRGRKNKPASVLIVGCNNPECSNQIRKKREAEVEKCPACKCFLVPMGSEVAGPGQRVTVLDDLAVVRHDISTNTRKIGWVKRG